jgi:hypothetical protein
MGKNKYAFHGGGRLIARRGDHNAVGQWAGSA